MITRKLKSLLDETHLMRDALSLLCVANLASWDALRMTYDGPGLLPPELWEARKARIGATSDEPFCSMFYNLASSNVQSYEPSNPLGVLVSKLVGRLAFSDPSLRPLSQYFFAAGAGGWATRHASHRSKRSARQTVLG